MPGNKLYKTLPMPDEWRNYYYKFAKCVADAPAESNFKFSGRGIITCAGGKYFIPAWVLINQLRALGCTLPIQIWYLGKEEISPEIENYVSQVPNVKLVDVCDVAKKHHIRRIGGWESKIYAIMYCEFEEVLFLDSDNVPTKNPEYLFDSKEYKETGSIFWPDYERLEMTRSIWQVCGVEWRDEEEFETGQIVVNKKQCWKPLWVTKFMNENSAFYYQHIWGDKDTFHMAWRACKVKYSMPPFPIYKLPCTMCQHDFSGEIIFQHRNLAKWSLGSNMRILDFKYEEECLAFLKILKTSDFYATPGLLFNVAGLNSAEKKYLQELVGQRHWRLKLEGSVTRPIELLTAGRIGNGRKPDTYSWTTEKIDGVLTLIILTNNGKPSLKFNRLSPSRWKGSQVHQVRYSAELKSSN